MRFIFMNIYDICDAMMKIVWVSLRNFQNEFSAQKNFLPIFSSPTDRYQYLTYEYVRLSNGTQMDFMKCEQKYPPLKSFWAHIKTFAMRKYWVLREKVFIASWAVKLTTPWFRLWIEKFSFSVPMFLSIRKRWGVNNIDLSQISAYFIYSPTNAFGNNKNTSNTHPLNITAAFVVK